MKILPIVNSISKDIGSTSKRLSRASKDGYQIGLRTSQIYNQGEVSTILNISKSVGKKIKKQTNLDDLPIISGAIGMLLPIPFASVIMLAAGKIVQVLAKALHKP